MSCYGISKGCKTPNVPQTEEANHRAIKLLRWSRLKWNSYPSVKLSFRHRLWFYNQWHWIWIWCILQNMACGLSYHLTLSIITDGNFCQRGIKLISLYTEKLVVFRTFSWNRICNTNFFDLVEQSVGSTATATDSTQLLSHTVFFSFSSSE